MKLRELVTIQGSVKLGPFKCLLACLASEFVPLAIHLSTSTAKYQYLHLDMLPLSPMADFFFCGLCLS